MDGETLKCSVFDRSISVATEVQFVKALVLIVMSAPWIKMRNRPPFQSMFTSEIRPSWWTCHSSGYINKNLWITHAL